MKFDLINTRQSVIAIGEHVITYQTSSQGTSGPRQSLATGSRPSTQVSQFRTLSETRISIIRNDQSRAKEICKDISILYTENLIVC